MKRERKLVAAFKNWCLLCLLAFFAAAPVTVEAEPIYGFADLHAHQFSNLGLGGLIIWGAPFSPDGNPATALPYSDFMGVKSIMLNPLPNPLLFDPMNPYVTSEVLGILNLPAQVYGQPFWRLGSELQPMLPLGLPLFPTVAIHGPLGVADILNAALTHKYGHEVGGYPEFDGWPAYDVLTAQKMYYEWLERSWKGGQRLMVMLAVNNKTLCSAAYHRADFGCEDMPAIERQIQAAKDLEAFIDNKDDGAVNGSGWYRIVYSAAEAREAASAGKLAVVLGVETPALLGCTIPAANRGECTSQSVREGVQHLYDIGVRHVYPVHNADNAFGGTALYKDLFDINSAFYNEGQWITIGACPQNSDNDQNNDINYHNSLRDKIYNFQQGENTALDEYDTFTRTLLDVTGIATTPIQAAPAGANCNPRGLTNLGRVLIDELVNHKIIIDGDHTSTVTFDNIITRLEGYGYPAVSVGHASIVEMGIYTGTWEEETNRNERNKDITQLKRVRNLGGTIAVILEPEGTDRVAQYYKNGTTPIVPFICGHSSEAWAQEYLAAKDLMGPDGAVALGSDFNGLAGLPAPRFGSNACNGHAPNPYVATGGVDYSNGIGVHGQPGVRLPQYAFGNKLYDYNYDGMAHVGLLPDFIQDLISLTANTEPTFIEPLFRSTEAYIQAWERIDAPNLKMHSLSSPPAYAGTGGSFDVTDVTIKSFSSAYTVVNSITRFYLSTDGEFSNNDIVIGERTVSFTSGSNSEAVTTVMVPASTTSGADYYLIACADATGAIYERSEKDNCLASPNKIRVGAPDLIVTGISANPAAPVLGESVSVTVTVKNQGSADAGSFVTAFYKNEIYCSGICPPLQPTFTCSLSGLNAGVIKTCAGTANYDAAGTYNMYAKVDEGNSVMESNESNNVFGPQSISMVSGPDLIVQSIATNPVSPVPGQSVSVTLTIKNQGDSGTYLFSPLYVDFYQLLPAGTIPNPPGDAESFTCAIVEPVNPPYTDGVLQPGETASCVSNVIYSAAGTYNMWAYVDSTLHRQESNESNNAFGPQNIDVGLAPEYSLSVNSTADDVDAKIGDGICATAGGECTLRAAIQEANAVPGIGTTINVPAGEYTLTIPGAGEDNAASGDLDILYGTVNIVGEKVNSTVINGHTADRIFDILPGATANISHVTVIHGSAPGDAGGCISNEGTLSLTDSVVTGCSAAFGGGVYNHGIAEILNSVISENSAAYGGGIYNKFNVLTLNGSTINKNSATAMGGGINNHISGTVNIINSTISWNTGGGNGGGICNEHATSALSLLNSIVANNSAVGVGGGVWIKPTSSSIQIINNIVYNNSASLGGGLDVSAIAGAITVLNNTVSGNLATETGGGLGVNLTSDSATADITNNIIWANTAQNTLGSPCAGGDMVLQATDPADVTVSYNDSSSLCLNGVSATRAEGNLNADPLFVDAGSGNYHLAGNSPLIDRGKSGHALLPAVDIDGNNRVIGAAVEIGADEVATPAAPSALTSKATSSSNIVLEWNDNSTNETGFRIYRKAGICSSTNPWGLIASPGVDKSSYTNNSLSPNTAYAYQLRAYNAGGASKFSNCASATTGKTGTPAAPTGLKAVSQSLSNVTLTWVDKSANETSFRISRKAGSGSWMLLKNIAAGVVGYSDTTANGNNGTTSYSYYVQACNSSGCSPLSAAAEVPFMPTMPVATAGQGNIVLTWQDNSSNESAFEVRRKPGACSSPNAWTVVGTIGSNITSYSNTGLTPGTYSYLVRTSYKSLAAPHASGYSRGSACRQATVQ